MDPDTRINEWWTVGELETEFEGVEYKPHDRVKGEPHFYCDWCSKGVSYRSKPTVGWYVADMVMNTGHHEWQAAVRAGEGVRPMVPLAVYCEECAARKLLFPCRGYGELHAFFEVDTERVMKNIRVTDVSPADDGIPWEPREVAERVTGIDFEQQMLTQALSGEDQLWGPENMITFFLASTGIDPRELIQYDGSLDPKVLGRARKAWRSFQKKMTRGGDYSRRKFRDYVRDEREG